MAAILIGLFSDPINRQVEPIWHELPQTKEMSFSDFMPFQEKMTALGRIYLVGQQHTMKLKCWSYRYFYLILCGIQANEALNPTKLFSLLYAFNLTMFTLSTQLIAQHYYSEKGQVSFFSEAPIENISAINEDVSAIIDSQTGGFAFRLKIKDLLFLIR